ncbi:MAG: UDP-N-acetylmuramoyl-L-alanine--D-glutamate ligase [Bdellovibrionales bacterium]|nr:UDP-N-acetylmuramoyl-L-alanine--D-glutamate ligase [Bdellovibrionales bacterium]
MELSELSGKKIAVIGLGQTGIALSRFLLKHNAKVTISDHKSEAELSVALETIQDLPLKFELEGHNPKTLIQQDYVILSPGVPSHLKLFNYVKSQGIKVTGEFEFASRFIKEPMTVITGTNGKTTVLDIAHLFLKESGVNVWVGGNHKQALSQYLYEDKKADVLLIEASSFMLEHVEQMKAKTLVFTNLAANHLDRYASMKDYMLAKRRIFINTSAETTSILNADSNAIIEMARDPVVQRGCIFYFSTRKVLKPQIMNIGGAVLIGDEIQLRTKPDIEYYSLKNCLLKGKHSKENMMTALLIAKEHGGEWSALQKSIDLYKGLPHRLEYVRKVGGVNFYNDSKATNVLAVMRALEAFEDNVILIMGGKDTGLDYKPLAPIIKRKVKSLILIGDAKENINRHIGQSTETFLIGTFDEAVFISYHKSRIGDTVLLSPGCPSFDMFSSYIERGRHFKSLVKKFK